MSDLVVLHNPRCSTSRAALDAIDDAGLEARVVLYLKTPLTRAELVDLVDSLDDEPTDLVRRDANFAKLGLTQDDVATADQVVDTLVAHPELLQRPVLRHGSRAIIGRPKDRVPTFFTQLPTGGNETS